MNSDCHELIRDLTFSSPESCETLVSAARLRRENRTRQCAGAAGAAAMLLLGSAAALLRPAPVSRDAAAASAPSPMLTSGELLDSFGDRPVALVTWPDGRQQLLAIATVPRAATKAPRP